MFQRKGLVKVALENGHNQEARKDQLIEAALEASAEDFEELRSGDGSTEIKVSQHQNLIADCATIYHF